MGVGNFPQLLDSRAQAVNSGSGFGSPAVRISLHPNTHGLCSSTSCVPASRPRGRPGCSLLYRLKASGQEGPLLSVRKSWPVRSPCAACFPRLPPFPLVQVPSGGYLLNSSLLGDRSYRHGQRLASHTTGADCGRLPWWLLSPRCRILFSKCWSWLTW